MSTLKVSNINNPSASAGGISIDSSGSLSGALPYPNRNLLINGAFDVWQRGTSFTTISNIPTYSADRWFGFVANTVNQAQIIRDSSAPEGFLYSAKFGRPSGETDANQQYICQCIESFNFIRSRGQKITLSFWAKTGSNYSGGNLLIKLSTGTTQDQSAGTFSAGPATGYTGNIAVLNTSVSINSTWTKYTFTSASVIPSNALSMGLAIGYTPSGTAGADDNIYISGVQLETGSVATPFEFKTFNQELRECLRYYEKSFKYSTTPANGVSEYGNAIGTQTTATATVFIWNKFLVEKRSSPNVTLFNPRSGGTTGRMTNSAADDSGATLATNIAEKGFMAQSGAALGANNWYVHYTASSEL